MPTDLGRLVGQPPVPGDDSKNLAVQWQGKQNGAAGRIRTHDPLVRSQVLYPTELQPREERDYTMEGRLTLLRPLGRLNLFELVCD